MPPFNRDLTNPPIAAVEAAMSEAVQTANGKARVGLLEADRADYRKFLAGEFTTPEGVMMWLADKGRVVAYPPTPRDKSSTGRCRRRTSADRAGARPHAPTHRPGPQESSFV
jgi:hypothetical protein